MIRDNVQDTLGIPAPTNRRGFMKLGAAGVACAMPLNRLLAQGGRPSPNSIDMHAHWTPEPYARQMAALGRPTFANGSQLNPLMYQLPKRLEWMDEKGIRTHVLTLSGNMPWWWAEPADAMSMAQGVNDAALAAHAAYPERFLVGLALPIKQPEAALRELNRMAGKPGVCSIGLPNSMNGQDYLFEPAYLPFLARAEELGLPLLFHPLDFPPNYYGGPERLAGSHFLYNTVGFPTEHANTAGKFIVSGLLDRFPKLQILLAHAGGSFPMIAGRIEHSIRMNASSFKPKGSFRDYVRRFHFDTLTYSVPGLRFLIETVGIDRVVIGTDVFAAMAVTDPNALVEELNLPPAQSAMIFRGNALRMMGMKG